MVLHLGCCINSHLSLVHPKSLALNTTFDFHASSILFLLQLVRPTASLKVSMKSVTLPTLKDATPWPVNALAELNISSTFARFVVVHITKFVLNFVAPLNIFSVVVTADTSHLRQPLTNDVAIANVNPKSVTYRGGGYRDELRWEMKACVGVSVSVRSITTSKEVLPAITIQTPYPTSTPPRPSVPCWWSIRPTRH